MKHEKYNLHFNSSVGHKLGIRFCRIQSFRRTCSLITFIGCCSLGI